MDHVQAETRLSQHHVSHGQYVLKGLFLCCTVLCSKTCLNEHWNCSDIEGNATMLGDVINKDRWAISHRDAAGQNCLFPCSMTL